MDKRKAFALLGLLSTLLVASGVLAISSANYAINWDVMGGGGGPISSASYSMNSTIGQAIIGSKSSASYELGSGYWPGGVVEYLVYLPLIFKNYGP